MIITMVRRPATKNVPENFALKSIGISAHYIWCCEEMQKQWMLSRIGIGGQAYCNINPRAVVGGLGLEFNYCFNCGEKITITIEEIVNEATPSEVG